jgi:hypothetical protein
MTPKTDQSPKRRAHWLCALVFVLCIVGILLFFTLPATSLEVAPVYRGF